ncbi:hypothetical protein BBK14_17035 [Parafrankia soli]|uniref:Uncharacterized protein n=1 Tax=Parafrankia soli TaxID=2599596 RepID=A0A1S1Q7F6_9ACTN|nr:hypothetical protein BBK14_17035 [Parafrankia soli]
MFIGCNVIMTSGGESTAGIDSRPEDPRWIDSTVPVSQHAVQTGSQYSLWKLGPGDQVESERDDLAPGPVLVDVVQRQHGQTA